MRETPKDEVKIKSQENVSKGEQSASVGDYDTMTGWLMGTKKKTSDT